MSDLDVKVDAQLVLRTLHLFVENLRGVDMADVGQALVTATEDKIQAEGAVGGMQRWPELSMDVLLRRPGARMLQATGLLAQIQSTVEGPESVLLSSPAPYAGFQVEGTRHMPPRDFFDIDFDSALEQAGLTVLDQVADV